MKTIEYVDFGECLSDHEAETEAKRFLTSDLEYKQTSNDIFIAAVRVEVAEGRYPHDQVRFSYKDDIILLNRYAQLSTWPRGFCDVMEGLLHRIVKAGVENRKKE
jgi:hypothetical protein